MRKEYQRAYYQAHKEQIKEQSKAYHQAHKEQIKAYHQAHKNPNNNKKAKLLKELGWIKK